MGDFGAYSLEQLGLISQTLSRIEALLEKILLAIKPPQINIGITNPEQPIEQCAHQFEEYTGGRLCRICGKHFAPIL